MGTIEVGDAKDLMADLTVTGALVPQMDRGPVLWGR